MRKNLKESVFLEASIKTYIWLQFFSVLILSKGNIRNVMMLLKKWCKHRLVTSETQPISTQGNAINLLILNKLTIQPSI